MPTATEFTSAEAVRHSRVVRVTHWLTVLSFVALLVTGSAIVLSHPRFYWGEVGNVNTRPLFTLPLPSSRDTVPTRYHFQLPDENGWSRYLHFEAAWALLFTGAIYLGWGLWTGHFRDRLLPRRGERNWIVFWRIIRNSLRREPSGKSDTEGYKPVQGIVYLLVIFVAFPLIIWTGLAMSPSFTSAFPQVAQWVGGRQSARTIHFFLTGILFFFVLVHVAMVSRAGFKSRMRAMITGRYLAPRSHR